MNRKVELFPTIHITEETVADLKEIYDFDVTAPIVIPWGDGDTITITLKVVTENT